MARITIDLPEDLRPLVEARATEGGFSTLASYVESLIRHDAESLSEDYGAPPELTFRSHEELEAALIEAASSPTEPVTPEDWADLRRSISEK